MKKILALLLAVLMCSQLAGCDNGKVAYLEDDKETSSRKTAVENKEIPPPQDTEAEDEEIIDDANEEPLNVAPSVMQDEFYYNDIKEYISIALWETGEITIHSLLTSEIETVDDLRKLYLLCTWAFYSMEEVKDYSILFYFDWKGESYVIMITPALGVSAPNGFPDELKTTDDWTSEIVANASLLEEFQALLDIYVSKSNEILGIESNSKEKEKASNAEATEQENAPSNGTTNQNSGKDYEITYSNVYVDKPDTLGNVYANVIVEVVNVGDFELYLSSGDFDLEDENGKLVKSFSASVFPTIIGAGEKACYYEHVGVDEGYNDLSVIPHIKVEKAKIENIRFALSDLELFEKEYWGLHCRGRVENATSEEERIAIAIILYDKNNTPLGVVRTYETVSAGDKKGFEASALGLPDNVNLDTVEFFEAFAYPWLQYQF